MAADISQIIERLKSKTRLVTERYAIVLDQRNKALDRVKELESQAETYRARIRQLQVQIEHLTVVTTLVPDRRDVEKSRAVLSGLVREIDKCIKDLKE